MSSMELPRGRRRDTQDHPVLPLMLQMKEEGPDTPKVTQLLLPMKRSFCKNLLRFSYSRSSEFKRKTELFSLQTG